MPKGPAIELAAYTLLWDSGNNTDFSLKQRDKLTNLLFLSPAVKEVENISINGIVAVTFKHPDNSKDGVFSEEAKVIFTRAIREAKKTSPYNKYGYYSRIK